MLQWMFQHKKNKKAAMIALGFFVAVFLFFIIPEIASAQAEPDVFGVEQVEGTIKLGSQDIRVIVAKIIRAALGLLGIITLGFMLYAGFLIMTSGGNEDKVEQGKKTLTNATIGLVIILSSMAIVQFVLNQLSDATGLGNGSGRGGAPSLASFAGSGALGFIIEDHYPFRNQKEVKRNTKIAVTFAEPMDPASIIINTNGTCLEGGQVKSGDDCERGADGKITNPYYGDCLAVANLNPETDCDHLATSSVKIFPFATSSQSIIDAFERGQNPQVRVVEAVALTTYDAQQDAYTFLFKPVQPIGDAIQPVKYDVYLTGSILKKTGVPAFRDDRFGDNYYDWNFETDTLLDLDPPAITSIYPKDGAQGYRNSVVKINFNEAVDPIAVQGLTGPTTTFNNIIFGNASTTGQWKISNGYTTVEFISDQACGQNSCGDTMYCLPVRCQDPGNRQCVTSYEVLVRTADLLRPGSGSFEAIPFSGVVDMADNALDGRSGNNLSGDGVPQDKPNLGDPKQIIPAERAADNAWWNFGVRNDIDRTPPNVEEVLPLLDEESVEGDARVEITFSKPMLNSSLVKSIRITEYPNALPFWQRVRARDTDDDKSIGLVDHREFGPDDQDLYYFTAVSSSVKSVTQNCLYPGFGPLYQNVGANGQAPLCTLVVDANGVPQPNGNCVPVNAQANTDTGCAQRVNLGAGTSAKSSIEACIQQLRDLSPI